MSDTNVAPGGGEGAAAPAPVVTPADASPISTRDAARALSMRRWEKNKDQPAETPPPAAAPEEPGAVEPQKLPDEGNAAPPEAEAPGETTGAEPADDLPPIEPPRSWTKDEKDRFKSYPRELQAYLSEREQERERTFRTSQNEAAEQRKAAEAVRAQAEKARQDYEAKLPILLQQLHEVQAGAFADIKTPADAEKLAAEDPFRYLQYTAHLQRVSAVQQEMRAAQERQSQEWNSAWSEFAQREDAKTAEKIPELTDPEQRSKVQQSALNYLKDTGFSEQDLGLLWNGQVSLSLRDHRVQVMIRDAVKYHEGKENAKKAIAAKPLPPVQRPGVAAPKGAAQAQAVQNLSKKLDQTGSLKDAAALLNAKRAASR